jgi:hypothetical protein
MDSFRFFDDSTTAPEIASIEREVHRNIFSLNPHSAFKDCLSIGDIVYLYIYTTFSGYPSYFMIYSLLQQLVRNHQLLS